MVVFGRTSFFLSSHQDAGPNCVQGRVAVSYGRRRLINVFPKIGTSGLDLLKSKGVPHSRTLSRTTVNEISGLSTMVASKSHGRGFDYPLLAGGCMAAARLTRSNSCRALDDDLALAPGVVAAL